MMAAGFEHERVWTKAESQAFRRKRRGRNLALLAALAALVVLFYAITIAKMGGN